MGGPDFGSKLLLGCLQNRGPEGCEHRSAHDLSRRRSEIISLWVKILPSTLTPVITTLLPTQSAHLW